MIRIEIISNGLLVNFPEGKPTYYKTMKDLIDCVTEEAIGKIHEITTHHDSVGEVYNMQFELKKHNSLK